MLPWVLLLSACTTGPVTRLGQPGDSGLVIADSGDTDAGDSGDDSGSPTDSDGPADTGPDSGAPPDTAADSGTPADTDTGTPPDPCAAAPGSLGTGDHYDVSIDDFSGDGETTSPRTDANDGRDGDNPYFQRVNVARAHCASSGCYWYTSDHQESGEPDPGGDQHVDYRPPFPDLGVGTYRIVATYRQSDNRASYPAVYEVHHRDGVTTVEQDQREGTEMVDIDLGTFWMCPDSYVRVSDPGSDSITMNAMDFYWGGG